MKKQKPQACIRFTVYMEKEGYIIEIRDNEDEEWGFDTFYPCFERKGGSDKDYVHFSVLKRLSWLQFLGYEVDIFC